jgi:hypothetical protein
MLLVEHGDLISENLKLFQVFFLKHLELLLLNRKIILFKQFLLNLDYYMKEKNLKIQQIKFIILVKLFFQIFQLKNYHFVNI